MPSLIVAFIFIYWLVLVSILRRPDFDTQQRILWFLVITMAPVLGLLAYWYIGSGPQPYRRPTQPVSDLSGTPWEGNPSHTKSK